VVLRTIGRGVMALAVLGAGSLALASPAAAAIPPDPPAGVTVAAAHQQVLLKWTVPADPDIQQIIVRREMGAVAPADPTSGTAVYSGLGTSVTDTGLTDGVPYTYALWSVAAGPVYSTQVTISAVPVPRVSTSVSLTVDRKRLDFGSRVLVSAKVVDQASGKPLRGESVELQGKVGGTDHWRKLSQGKTDNKGRVAWREALSATTALRVVHLATPVYARSVSPRRNVQLQPKLSARLGKDWVRQSGRAVVRGRVRPGHRDGPVVLERRTDTGWVTAATDRQNAQGKYRFSIGGWPARGTLHYRVVEPETAKHRRAVSAPMSLDVVRLVTYQIETRGHIVASLDAFKQRVAEVYADPRGWSRADVRFQRVKRGGDFSVVLSQARDVAKFAPICDTYYSCSVGRYVVINQNRWRFGTPYFLKTGDTLSQYRAMVINHETGHWFGLGHSTCSKRGALAPVMMQQSKGLYGCKPNPWPLPSEIAAVR